MDHAAARGNPPGPDGPTSRTDDATPRRFFFLHLQKTGGTSLFFRLRRCFGERAVYPMPEYERSFETNWTVDLLLERFERHRDDIRVVSGHFPYCVPELLGEPFVTFTVLRDPVARSLSYLRQQRDEVPEFRDRTLTEIYDEPVRRNWFLTNHMVRMLTITIDDIRAWTDMVPRTDEERLDTACANLAQMDVVGVQEHFEEFCAELAGRYDLDLGEPVVANTSPPYDAEPGLVQRIEDDNQVDLALYRFALDLVRRRAA